MGGKHTRGPDEPPRGPLVRGFIGSGLAIGGLLLIGMTTTVAGAIGFAVACLARWKRRRE